MQTEMSTVIANDMKENMIILSSASSLTNYKIVY